MCSCICSLGLSSVLLLQQLNSLINVSDEEFKVLQVPNHLFDLQIDQHACHLWSLVMANDSQNEVENCLTDSSFVVWILRNDSWQNL